MRHPQQQRAGKELEITVIRTETQHNEMRLRINGSSTFARIPFQVSETEARRVEELYEELDGESHRDGDFYRYGKAEEQLGRLLGEILMRGADGKRPELTLGAILESCLVGLGKDEYVRLLLSFEDEALRAMPWELAMWSRPHSKELVCLGCDHRFALSRLDPGHPHLVAQRLFGSDGVLSVLNVGADGSDAGRASHALTAGFLERLARHLPRLHAVSLPSEDLQGYLRAAKVMTGQQPRFDIVHWSSHGSARSIEERMGPDDYVSLTPWSLVRQTDRPFLFMMISCDSEAGGAPGDADGVSSELLAAGAPAVLGMHQTVRQDEFTYVPILGALLFLGLPLDHSVQYLRSMLAAQNDSTRKAARNRWHKLVLRAASSWYLDATITRREGSGSVRQSLVAMTAVFDELYQAHDRTRTEACQPRDERPHDAPARASDVVPQSLSLWHEESHGGDMADVVAPTASPAMDDASAALISVDAPTAPATEGTPTPFTQRLADSKFFS
jgi:hypothetical protein